MQRKMFIIVKLHTNKQCEFNCKTFHNPFLVHLSVYALFWQILWHLHLLLPELLLHEHSDGLSTVVVFQFEFIDPLALKDTEFFKSHWVHFFKSRETHFSYPSSHLYQSNS